jgi:glycosyltransferase involved in cell wall biosynthesis
MQTDPADLGRTRISVVVPAFNAAGYLAAALQSVADQSVRPYETIVVDDGSTDETQAVARSFGVTVIARANAGVSAARNTGTQAASGDYIAYLDADDVWAPEKLAVQSAALASYGRPAFAFTDYRMFDERGPRRRSSELSAHWAFRKIAGKISGRTAIVIEAGADEPVLYDSYIPPSAVLVRRADVLAAGGFDETLHAAEDYDFLLRLLRLVPGIAIMKPLLFYRQHAGQATAKTAAMKAGFFEVARRVAASPASYRAGDARYIARTEYLRHYRVGMQQARIGAFDEAVLGFERSLTARPSLGAWLALLGSRLCRSALGRGVFHQARSLWKRRPGRR